MNTLHKKITEEYFEKIATGKKKFEIRLADFEVEEDDTLILEEWDQDREKYTGRKVEVTATYVLKTQDLSFGTKENVDKYGFQIIQFNAKQSESR